jgi:aminocarboxymuconate-semialdehyde decarboxylase
MTVLIDVHSHLYPAWYLERLRQNKGTPRVHRLGEVEYLDIFPGGRPDPMGPGQPITDGFTSGAAKLAFMDAAGIDQSVVSVGNPWVDFLSPGEAVFLATELNEYMETVCSDSRGRLYGLGVVPLQCGSEALAELDRIRQLPHLRGLVVPAKPALGPLDHPALLPFWEKVEATNLPVLLHPHWTTGWEDFGGHGPLLPLVFGFPFETSVAAARLVVSGLLRRFPRLDIILAHAGGTLPFLAGRLDQFTAGRPDGPSVMTDVSRFWCDGLTYHPAALRCAAEVIGRDRVMFGTDHPFGSPNGQRLIETLAAAGFDEATEQSVRGGAAARLFHLGPQHLKEAEA